MNKAHYATGGTRLTNCCKAFSTYDSYSEMLLCNTCGHAVVGGEGDGTENKHQFTTMKLTGETAKTLHDLLEWASLYLGETIEDARVCVKKYGKDQEFIDTYEPLYNTAQKVMKLLNIDGALGRPD